MLYDIITEIENTNGTNAKLAVFKTYKDNQLLKNFLQALLSPRIKFYIHKYDENGVGQNDFTQSHLDSLIENLSTRKITGNTAQQFVENMHKDLNEKGQQCLKWLLKQGLRIGISTTSINKVYGDEVIWEPAKHYMRCSLPSEKIISGIDFENGNAVVQIKYDGSYHEVGKEIGVRTRSGNTYPIKPFNTDNIDGIVMGELIIKDKDGNTLDRKTGNGIINSALSGNAIPPEYKAVLMAWDWRPADKDCTMPYRYRFQELQKIVEKCDFIEIVESFQVDKYEKALEKASEFIANGEEGAILKDLNAPWVSGTSKYQVKLKVECDADLIAVEFVQGNVYGRHSDTFGSIKCKSADGKIEVNVSGFTDKDRKDFSDNPDKIIGKVVSVTFNDIITRNGESKASLFLPRFNEVRHDKLEADTSERIVEIFETLTGVKKSI